MKILIDTSLSNLFIHVMDDNFASIATFNEVEKRKADELPKVMKKLMKDNKFEMKDVVSLYITLGPGSFMGARTALVYARTIAQVSNTKLYTANTFALYKTEAFIDAKGGMAYATGEKLIDYDGEFTIPDYKDIITNPKDYLDNFELQSDLVSIEPHYVKDPQIGGK